MSKRIIGTAITGLFIAIVLSGSLNAWGVQGHRLVALVATARLTPAAKANVMWLMPDRTLAEVAIWADDYRVDHNASASWHYVNPPVDAAGYDRDRDCPRQPGVATGSRSDRWRDCVIDRLLYNQRVLADSRADRADRAVALKFLVHFVGDVHQPFHAFIVGRGGNDIPVVVFGSPDCPSFTGGTYPCNLHSVWDSTLVERRRWSDPQYVEALGRLIAERKLDGRPTGTPAEWAMESLRLAGEAVLPPKGAVDEAYFGKHIGTVDERLALGGLRLAALINESLKTPPPR